MEHLFLLVYIIIIAFVLYRVVDLVDKFERCMDKYLQEDNKVEGDGGDPLLV